MRYGPSDRTFRCGCAPAAPLPFASACTCRQFRRPPRLHFWFPAHTTGCRSLVLHASGTPNLDLNGALRPVHPGAEGGRSTLPPGQVCTRILVAGPLRRCEVILPRWIKGAVGPGGWIALRCMFMQDRKRVSPTHIIGHRANGGRHPLEAPKNRIHLSRQVLPGHCLLSSRWLSMRGTPTTR